MKTLHFILGLLIASSPLFSQVINGYAKVNSISSNTLTLTNVSESGNTFEDGDEIIIMQMQDNVIGTNTSNNSSFGNLATIASAGLYEVRTILSHTESSSLPNTITLDTPPENAYNINSHSSIQIITFKALGTPNFTTPSNLTALPWNGNIGGVLAINVVGGIFTLANNLSVNGQGFRGGANDKTQTNGNCEDNVFISTWTTRAFKGEGIYKNTNTLFEAARGKILNGGGGGASHNGGGAGGGNFTSGGNGGIGWGCRNLAPRSCGGLGGVGLSSVISEFRIFMGGGGGAGERNNNWNTSGGNGGGIILIKADQIITTGSCGSISISANGENSLNIGNDGAGGAGGAGSIIIEVNTWTISPTCPITISANGGDGGSVNSSTHGGGGGGGQGVVIYSIVTPTINTTTSTNNGSGGCSNNSSPCNSSADGGSGIDGSGIIDNTSGPLPIKLIDFTAKKINSKSIRTNWQTASEINNDFFTIERSQNGINWKKIGKINGAGNSSALLKYSFIDQTALSGTSYYRLKQTDFNGNFTYSAIRTVQINQLEASQIKIYPNPSNNHIWIEGDSFELEQIKIYNVLGKEITIQTKIVEKSSTKIVIDLSNLIPAMYYIKTKTTINKIIKQ